MKRFSKLIFCSLLICSMQHLVAQEYLNYALNKPVATSQGSARASLITDGTSPSHQWRCVEKDKEQWVAIDMTAIFEIHALHIHFDMGNMMPLDSWVLQYMHNGEWINIPDTRVAGNFKSRVEQRFGAPISTDKVRLLCKNREAFGIDEIQIWGSEIPSIPYGVEMTLPKPYVADRHWVCANQIAYNIGAPKGFTVPTAKSNLEFTIVEKGGNKVLYRGKLEGCKGNFTQFNPKKRGVEYVIKVEGDGLPAGESYPFEIGKGAIQRMSYSPAVDFMSDVRSIVGTHNSAFGGTPWRDGTYYTYELPSMVMLYLSNPSHFNEMPITLDWQADSLKVVNPDLRCVKSHNDRDALPTAQSYYTLLQRPMRDDVPDIIQNIRFAAGWYLLDPVTFDPSGDASGEKMHPETVEQLAFFLYGYPAMREYISEEFYRLVLNATLRWWGSVGLYDVITRVGTGKGRDCPGHSIMPNLMMYEVAKREIPELKENFMNAAIAQTEWIIANADWDNPIYTKGQRISEHKLATGLAHFYLNYRDFAPSGLKEKIEALGRRYVAMSENMWDFRRFDLEDNWTIPGFNECGNVVAFPACALGVAMCVDDEALRARLVELGYSHFDNVYGRNPLNTHAAGHPNDSFVGLDARFPYRYKDDVCARLELTRGSLSSLPGSEIYPFNPEGKYRWPEGWTAYNSAWNVSLSLLNFYESHDNSWKVLCDPLYTSK